MMWLKMWLRKNAFISCLLVGLLALFSWWYFTGLGSYAFFDWDESIYAQIAKQSHHFPDLEWLGYSGDLGKQIWFEKPPLQIWLIQLSFRVFGVTEFAARIPSVVYGLLSILIAYFFSKSLSASRLHGILSVLSFALIGGFAFGVGYVGMDIAVGFWIFLALFAFWKSRENTKFWYLFWCALAFGFLTKSVIGLLPLPIILIFSALDFGSHKYRWLKNKDFWLGFVLFLAISSPWVIYESFHYGKAFWDSFLLRQVLSRFTTGLQDSNTGPWNFYFSIFSPEPFGFLGLASLLFALWEFCKKRLEMLLPFVSIVFIFLFFSLSQTKILWYVSMVYPLFAILIGYSLYSLIVRVKWRWLKYLSLGVFVLTCVWFGVVFQKSKLVILQEQRYADIRRIGEFLQNNKGNIYYISLYGSDMITQSYPALVYYSGQYVKEVVRDFVDWKNQKSIFRTPTHQVYKINGDFYVVAVRYYP